MTSVTDFIALGGALIFLVVGVWVLARPGDIRGFAAAISRRYPLLGNFPFFTKWALRHPGFHTVWLRFCALWFILIALFVAYALIADVS
jgi:hypothetical protein